MHLRKNAHGKPSDSVAVTVKAGDSNQALAQGGLVNFALDSVELGGDFFCNLSFCHMGFDRGAV